MRSGIVKGCDSLLRKHHLLIYWIEKLLITHLMFGLEDYEEIRDRLLNNDQAQQALDEFEAVLLVEPNNVFALDGKASALGELKRWEEANCIFDQAIKLNPKVPSTWYGKGVALRYLGQNQEAIHALKKAIELDPHSAQSWYEKGMVLNSLGDHHQAIDDYEKAIVIDANFSFPWNGKGNTLNSLGQHLQALFAFEKAIELDPESTYSWNGKGNAYNSLGQHYQALDAYEKGIKVDPHEAYLWYGRAITFNSLGQYQKSIDSFEKAIELDSTNGNFWNGIGNVFNDLEQFHKALKAFEKAIELNPMLSHSWHGKGIALDSVGQNHEAIEAFKKAIEIDPNLPAFWHGMGTSLNNIRSYHQAIESYEKAIGLDPNYVFPLYGKGNVLISLRRYKDAIYTFEKAIKINPKWAYSWHGLGLALSHLTQYKKAINAFEKAIELDPNFAPSWISLSLNPLYGWPNRECAFRRGVFLARHTEMIWLLQNGIQSIKDFGRIRLSERLIQEFHLYNSISLASFCNQVFQMCEITDPILKQDRILGGKGLFIAERDRIYISGLIYYFEGDPEIGAELFDKVLDKNESRLDAWFYLILSRNGYAEDTKEDLRDAVKLAMAYNEQKIEADYGYNLYYAGQIALLAQQFEEALQLFDYASVIEYQHSPIYLPSHYMQLVCQSFLSNSNRQNEEGLTESQGENEELERKWSPEEINILEKIASIERTRLLDGEGYIHGVSYVDFVIHPLVFKRNFFRYVHFTEIIDGVYSVWEYLKGKNDPLVENRSMTSLHSPEKVWNVPPESVEQLDSLRIEQGNELAKFLSEKLDSNRFNELSLEKGDKLLHGLAFDIENSPRALQSNMDRIAYFKLTGKISSHELLMLAFYVFYCHKQSGGTWDGIETEFHRNLRGLILTNTGVVSTALLTTGTIAGAAGAIAVPVIAGLASTFVGKWIWEKLRREPKSISYQKFKSEYTSHVLELKQDPKYAEWFKVFDFEKLGD